MARWTGGEDEEVATREVIKLKAAADPEYTELPDLVIHLKSIVCRPQKLDNISPVCQLRPVLSPKDKQLSDEMFSPNSPDKRKDDFSQGSSVVKDLSGDTQTTANAMLPTPTATKNLTLANTPTRNHRRHEEWSEETFSPMSLRCANPYGDGRMSEQHLLSNTPIILARREVHNVEPSQLAHNTVEPTQLAQNIVKLKRKPQNIGFSADGPDGPSKKQVPHKDSQKETSLTIRPDGLYKIEVKYSHSMAIAAVTGASSALVDQVIKEDNRDRAVQEDLNSDQLGQQNSDEEQQKNWGDHSDVDSEAELEFEEGAAGAQISDEEEE